MKTYTKIPLAICSLIFASNFASAATATYNLQNSIASNALLDANGIALDSGTPNTQNGNGTVFQLGYFAISTSAFTGEWMPIAGYDSANASLALNIGDFTGQTGSSPIPDGLFATSIIFDTEAGTAVGLPAADTQMAIRFYDGTDPSSNNYNTVTNENWVATSIPSGANNPTVSFNFDDPGTLSWQDSGNAFKTTLSAVPEPSSFALLGLGGLALAFRRRK